MRVVRKVLVSPGFGAGWATWNSECGKQLAEDPELIAMVESGTHIGETPDTRWPDTPPHRCSPAFLARAIEVGRAAGVTDENWAPFCGGVPDLEVQEVTGPYRIDEYDGSESLKRASEEVWW